MVGEWEDPPDLASAGPCPAGCPSLSSMQKETCWSALSSQPKGEVNSQNRASESSGGGLSQEGIPEEVT